MFSNQKRIALTVIVIIILILSALFSIISASENSRDNNPVFISTFGNWYVANESDILLNILFVDDKKESIFDKYKNEVTITFDNRNIEVQDFKVNKGDTYKEMRLYSIVMTARSKETGKQLVSQISLNYRGEAVFEDNIGEIVINITSSNRNKGIEIKNNTGSSTTFNKYEFSVLNSDKSLLTVDEILLGDFKDCIEKMKLDVNGNSIIQETKIMLKPGDQLNGTITFNNNNGQYLFKLFAPSLTYQHESDTEKYEYNFPYAMYGLPLNEDSLIELYSKFTD